MFSLHRTIPPIVAVLLLGLCALVNRSHPQPKDAEPYHAAIREAAALLPRQIGNWQGVDQEVPPAAIALLRPNVIVSRQYRNLANGESVGVLFVQCRDARDMAGHYPPVCYPAHGFTQESMENFDWQAGDELVPGTRYRFSILQQGRANVIYVVNFLMLPDGKIVRDMDSIRKAAGDYLHHFYGAAQMQLVFRDEVGIEKQKKIFDELVAEHLSLIRTVLTGAGNE